MRNTKSAAQLQFLQKCCAKKEWKKLKKNMESPDPATPQTLSPNRSSKKTGTHIQRSLEKAGAPTKKSPSKISKKNYFNLVERNPLKSFQSFKILTLKSTNQITERFTSSNMMILSSKMRKHFSSN